jgi:beta-lactamase regulating signal transducer with metallopeptidase domain
MTMSAFLLLLVKLNLAMGAAIVLVALLRRPLRAQFGAPIAYAIWLLVPVAGMASLLPPRVAPPGAIAAAPAPAASVPIISHIAHSTLDITEQLTGQSALALTAPPSTVAMPDTTLLLFVAWVLGAVLMTLHLARLQLRFSAAARAGKAGPAVLGFLRPRIVTPDGFRDHFTAQEQAAILAHESVHLVRQDARINALTALLRCLCWFNPLIHLGSRWLRVDQELACDATAVTGQVSRSTYAKALLKSQLVVTALPLGCNWPGAQHPLIERIALLKRKPPGAVRRLAGAGLVMLAATSAGLGAWAAQPPVTATLAAARPPAMVLATPPAPVAEQVAAPDQTAQEPAINANPTGSGHDADASKAVRADRVASAAPAPPRAISIEAPIVSATVAPPQIAPVSEPIADPSAYPTSQDASPEPKESLAKNTAGGPATADVTAAGTASRVPRPKTEVALACLLGMARAGCENAFVGQASRASRRTTPYEAGRLISYCAGDYVHKFFDRCPEGPLETVQYLGTNVGGDDVYIAKFMHQDRTYVLSQPSADGKIPALFIFRSAPAWVVRRKELVELHAPVLPPRTIYGRQE